jgi:lipopolysaccharide export system permease protein
MLKISQRYLASHFIGPFFMSTTFFVAFLLTFQLFRIVRIITSKDVDMTHVAELIGHIAISFLPLAIPLSVLFATIYTMNKLSEDSEIVAMRSFGMTKLELFTPLLILGLLISSSIFVLNRTIIPYSKTQFKNTIIKLTSKGASADIKSGQFFTEIPGVVLFAETVDEQGTKMKEVFLRLSKKGDEKVIFAKRGALIKQTVGELLSPTLRLHLTDGNIIKTFEGGKKIEKILFKEYDFPITAGGYLPGFVTKDSMRTNAELKEVISKKEKRLEELKGKDKLNAQEGHEKREILSHLPKSQLEYWTRLNTPLQVIIFVLLGFSIGIKKGRGRTRHSGALGLIILTGYYALFFAGVSMARKGSLPPQFAVFLPSCFATFIGGYFFKKIDWMS